MKRVFGFFLRLFIAFVAAKLVLGHLRADTPKHLVALTLVLLANAYLFDLLYQWNQGLWRRLQGEPQPPVGDGPQDPPSRLTP
jgi:hypothetical protein